MSSIPYAAAIAAARFHHLAAYAARHGGFWVSAGGGTRNVAAGIISRYTGCSYEEAHAALDAAGGPGWYADLAYSQPYGWDNFDEETLESLRWDVRTIARAACQGLS